MKEKITNKGMYKISFKKKDGSVREMFCTRDLSLIHKEYHPKGVNKTNSLATPVFDLQLYSWRSFSNDSLLAVEKVDVIPA